MPDKDKPIEGKLGPIPLERFDNDFPPPDDDDKPPKPGSLGDYIDKRIKQHKPKR